MKNILLRMKTLLLVVILSIWGAADAFSSVWVGGLKYNLNSEGTASVAKPDSKKDYSGDIVVPRSIYYAGKNYTVTSLGSECFFQTSITSITLPESITYLGYYSISNCPNLTSVTLPKSIEVIGSYCFYNCSNLTNVTIQEGVTSLGGGCFGLCERLYKVVLPSTVKEIGENMFVNKTSETIVSCKALTPPSLSSSMDSKVKVFVPTESLLKYRTNYQWSTAYSINPLDPVSSISLPTTATIGKANKIKLDYSVLPETAGTKTLFWSSSNPNIASVDENGEVTGVASGTTIIKATAKDGTDIYANCNVTVVGISINSAEVILKPTENITLVAISKPEGVISDNFSWSSSNEDIAFVTSDGTVWAMAEGEADITAHSDELSGINSVCHVKVTYLADEIKFEESSVNISLEESKKLNVIFTPENTSNKTLTWESSNTSVAMVDEDGTVHGVSKGKAIITATTTDGSNLSASCEVTVNVRVANIILDETEAIIKPDETLQLNATTAPDDATDRSIRWSSSEEDVAKVSVDGLVTAVAEGDADITAEAADGSGVKAVCHVKVAYLAEGIKFEDNLVQIMVGESHRLNVIFTPENTSNKQLEWTSSKPEIATVDEDGMVLGVSTGNTVVVAKTTDGTNKVASCMVITVSETSGIANLAMGNVRILLVNRHLSVEGLADGDVIQVVNNMGVTLYKGTKHEIDFHAAGIYMIKVKGKTMKLLVM